MSMENVMPCASVEPESSTLTWNEEILDDYYYDKLKNE